MGFGTSPSEASPTGRLLTVSHQRGNHPDERGGGEMIIACWP